MWLGTVVQSHLYLEPSSHTVFLSSISAFGCITSSRSFWVPMFSTLKLLTPVPLAASYLSPTSQSKIHGEMKALSSSTQEKNIANTQS